MPAKCTIVHEAMGIDAKGGLQKLEGLLKPQKIKFSQINGNLECMQKG